MIARPLRERGWRVIDDFVGMAVILGFPFYIDALIEAAREVARAWF